MQNNGRRKKQKTSGNNEVAPADPVAVTPGAKNSSGPEHDADCVDETATRGPPPGISDANDSSRDDSDCTLASFMRKKIKKPPRRTASKIGS